MQYFNTLIFLFLCFQLIFTKSVNDTLIKRSHSTCDPEAFGSINRQYTVTFFDQPHGSVGYLYGCEVHYDGSLIACRVDIPLGIDDFITYRVKRSTAYKCDKNVCGQPRTKKYNYIFDKKGNKKPNTQDGRITVGDHFCYRYEYINNNKKSLCDANFEILNVHYQYNTPKVIFDYGKYIKSLSKFAKTGKK